MVRVSRAWILKHVGANVRPSGEHPVSPRPFFKHLREHPVPKGGYKTDLSAQDLRTIKLGDGEGWVFSVEVPSHIARRVHCRVKRKK